MVNWMVLHQRYYLPKLYFISFHYWKHWSATCQILLHHGLPKFVLYTCTPCYYYSFSLSSYHISLCGHITVGKAEKHLSPHHSYHTSHSSVSVVRTTFKVYGKMQTLTISHPKTPEPIIIKFEWCDYIVDAYNQKKFGLNPPRGFAPHLGEIYTPPVRNLLHFVLFLVLELAYRRVR